MCGQRAAQLLQVQPQVVGVEEAVAPHVLKGCLVAVRTHRTLAQHQLPVRAPPAQVAALLVRQRTLTHLCTTDDDSQSGDERNTWKRLD